MPRMSNAPLRYVLVMMRFPKILNIGSFLPEFQEQIRADYPHLSDKKVQGVQLSVGPKGADSQQVTNSIWQFSSADRAFALVLGDSFLVLHAGRDYDGHIDFIERFEKAIAAYLRVDGLAKHFTSVGYRYVNLIVPNRDKEERVSQYLSPWVMPSSDLEGLSGISLLNSAFFAGFSTEMGGLRFQAMRNPPATLPPDLITPFVEENQWVEKRPESEFALLDLDHVGPNPSSPKIDPSVIGKQLHLLRKPIVEIFDKAVTPFALQSWK